MPTLAATVDLLQLVGEPTRVRLLALLAEKELSVADLTAITQLGQSRVSMHLARLREAGLVRDRRDGATTFYSLNEKGMPGGAQRVWTFLRGEVHDAQIEKDRQRRETLLRARARAGWPDALAGQMERHYSPGRTWESLARGLAGLISLGDVLDGGGGDGSIAQLLAPRARSYMLVDRSQRMIAAACERLKKQSNVSARVADLHDLPFAAAAFDTVLLFNVLTEVERPDAVLAEAHRVLRPGGTLALIVLDAHEHDEVAESWKHRHRGFAPAALRRTLTRLGFSVDSCEVTSRERRPPRLGVVTAFARKGKAS
jgi:DNA-binding transcriptional ArsR family regulator